MSDADKAAIEQRQIDHYVETKGLHPVSRKMAKAKRVKPGPDKPKSKKKFHAITTNGMRGEYSVTRPDGHNVNFKHASYHTDDAAEAKWLAEQPGITVEKQGDHGRKIMFGVGIVFDKNGKRIG